MIIAAAGGDKSWNGHLGVPRHMVPVEGEPLLQRTIRQALTLTRDVHVTTPDDDRYRVVGAVRHVREPGESEYACTRDLWSADGRTVLLLGDVYFTDRAMAVIGAYVPRNYRVFGRAGASAVTGTPWGEIFAASWWPEHHEQIDRYLAVVHALRAEGTITRPPGWMLLRAWQRTPLDRHIVKRGRYFTRIDDATDDFDDPADYERHPAMGGRA